MRPAVLAVGGWVTAVAAVATLSWLAIGAAGHGVGDPRVTLAGTATPSATRTAAPSAATGTPVVVTSTSPATRTRTTSAAVAPRTADGRTTGGQATRSPARSRHAGRPRPAATGAASAPAPTSSGPAPGAPPSNTVPVTPPPSGAEPSGTSSLATRGGTVTGVCTSGGHASLQVVPAAGWSARVLDLPIGQEAQLTRPGDRVDVGGFCTGGRIVLAVEPPGGWNIPGSP